MGKILVIEDEVLTRRGLVQIIKNIDENACILEAGSVVEAERIISTQNIDLFLIDIQLQDGDGLMLAKKIRRFVKYRLTHIIFITAVPTKAIMAYDETHCYSYIVKPFEEKYLIEQLSTLINYGYKKLGKKVEKLELNIRNYIYFVELDDILYIEAKNQRLYVVTMKEKIEVPKKSLKGLAIYLSENFFQCHKAFIINMAKIEEINKSERYVVLEQCNDRIPIGRKFYNELR